MSGALARKRRGVRTQDWKLIHFHEQLDERALYGLKHEPDELVNLIHDPAQADRTARLKVRLQQLRADTGYVDPPDDVAPKLQPGKCPA